MKRIYRTVLLGVTGFALIFTLPGSTGTDAVSSATCPAVKGQIPASWSLKVTGKAKHEYRLTSGYLSTLSTVRVRTIEISPGGKVMGAYYYQGIPLYFILDGIAPEKDGSDRFDRPLDMVVTLISSSGETACFSYGELTMCNDNNPVTLAWERKPLLPSKEPEKYKKNLYKRPLTGFRLICPGDLNDSRYLNDVAEMRLSLIPTSDHLFPKPGKGKDCRSDRLYVIRKGEKYEGSLENVPEKTIPFRFRVGHGRGIKSKKYEPVSGYSLKIWLKNHFGPGKPGDFYVFSGCDGYRSIFSWTEIYLTENGEKMILMKGEKGLTLGPTADFFVDRNIWALYCVEKVSRSSREQ